MTDKKLTDSEIVKAKAHFEYGIKCDIFQEPVLSYAKTVLEAFDEINRLQAELDEYKKIKTTINEFWEILLTLSLFKRKEKPTLEEFAEAIQEIKAEAYKECIEKATNKILPMLTTATLEKKETICFCLNELENLLKELVGNAVKCKDCEYLMFSDCYGECSKGYKGIVQPNDSCGKGKLKVTVGKTNEKGYQDGYVEGAKMITETFITLLHLEYEQAESIRRIVNKLVGAEK